MSTKSYAITIALVVVALLITMNAGFAAKVGETAPGFKLASVDGDQEVQLSRYFDKPTALVFWASWCPHCQRELPVLQNLYTNMKDKVNIVGVSLDDNKTKGASFVKSHSITFPNAYVSGGEAENLISSYGISGIPAVFVIDKGGKIISTYSGEVDKDVLKKQLDKLVAK